MFSTGGQDPSIVPVDTLALHLRKNHTKLVKIKKKRSLSTSSTHNVIHYVPVPIKQSSIDNGNGFTRGSYSK